MTDPDPRAELLLFEASRAQLIEQRILPGTGCWLNNRGRPLRRFNRPYRITSYQGYGREIDLERIPMAERLCDRRMLS